MHFDFKQANVKWIERNTAIEFVHVWEENLMEKGEKEEEEKGKLRKMRNIHCIYRKKYEWILVLFCNTLSMTKKKIKISAAFMQKAYVIFKEQTNEYLSPEYIVK